MSQNATAKCDKCQRVLRIGDFPMCNGNKLDHGPLRKKMAQSSGVIVMYQSVADPSKVWNPGIDTPSRTRQAPPGYQRIELKTQRERDKWERERGKILGVSHAAAHREMVSEHSAQQREMLARLSQIPCTTPQEKQARAMVERRISESRGVARPMNESYIEVNHYDQSNRDGHRGQDGRYRKE